MKRKIKFKIGEFSRLCRVTVKTLRHYEEINLLMPAEIDEWTGYRFYEISQLRLMNRISYLKKLGFQLSEISEILTNEEEYPEIDTIHNKIKLCQAQMHMLKQREARLASLEKLLINKDKIMEKVFEKSLPAGLFATHRRKIGSYNELFNLCPNIIGPEMHRLECKCATPEYCFTIEHQKEHGVDIDIEYFEAITEHKENSELLVFKELPEIPVALCMNHYGTYEKMPETFAELYTYAQTNGLEPTGLPRFRYIDGIWNKESTDEWLTEIQLPVN